MLTYLLDAHSDKLKEVPLRGKFTLGKFQGAFMMILVDLFADFV